MSDMHCALRPTRRAVLAATATASFVLGLLLAVSVGMLTECSRNLSTIGTTNSMSAITTISTNNTTSTTSTIDATNTIDTISTVIETPGTVTETPAQITEAEVTLTKAESSILPQRQTFVASRFEPIPDTSQSDGWTQLTVIATAYDAGKRSTGKEPGHPAYGVTYTGTRALEGRTVAVDPKVIPLGSEVKIPALSPYTYIAEDTGRLIKGNRIDIYMDTEQECLEWGVRTVKILFRPPKEVWGLNRNYL